MQDITCDDIEDEIRAAFEQLRPAVQALQARWTRRIEGVRLREYFAAVEKGMATRAPRPSSPGYLAAGELVAFLGKARRRFVRGPVLPALRAAEALAYAWMAWISATLDPSIVVTRMTREEAEEVTRLCEQENARAAAGHALGSDACAICAWMEARKRAQLAS